MPLSLTMGSFGALPQNLDCQCPLWVIRVIFGHEVDVRFTSKSDRKRPLARPPLVGCPDLRRFFAGSTKLPQ